MDIKENITNDTDFITINRSRSIMRAFDFIIKNENHTIGNLISNELQNYESQIEYASYKMPHPLEKQIILRVKINSQEQDIKRLQDETVRVIISVLEQLINKIAMLQFELKRKLNNNLLKACFTDVSYDMTQYSFTQASNISEEIIDDDDSISSDSLSESDED